MTLHDSTVHACGHKITPCKESRVLPEPGIRCVDVMCAIQTLQLVWMACCAASIQHNQLHSNGLAAKQVGGVCRFIPVCAWLPTANINKADAHCRRHGVISFGAWTQEGKPAMTHAAQDTSTQPS